MRFHKEKTEIKLTKTYILKVKLFTDKEPVPSIFICVLLLMRNRDGENHLHENWKGVRVEIINLKREMST